MLSLNDVVKCISLYISNQDDLLYSAHGTIIRDLCLVRDNQIFISIATFVIIY